MQLPQNHLKSDSHLPKKLSYLLQYKLFENNKKFFFFFILKVLFVLKIFRFVS